MQHFVKLSTESTGAEHNVLLPAIYDIVWGGISFVIILVLFAKFVMPAMRELTAARTEKIEGGLARAEASQEEAVALLEQYRAQLADSRAEAANIRSQAQAEKNAIIEAAKAEAAAAAAAVTERAQAQMEAERAQAMTSLRRDVSELALDLAGKVVGETLSDDARARATVDRFISELEAQAAK